MARDIPQPRLLARWHFTNEQWREFLYYEKLDSDSRNLVDLKAVLIGGLVIIFLIAFFGAAKGGLGVFVFVIAAGSLFIGLCYLVHWLIRRGNERRLQTETGEVQITSSWANVNGVVFKWGWNRPQIYKDYIYLGEEKMLLLQFTCTGRIRVRGVTEQYERKCLVPVPPGKEAEADFVISEITKGYADQKPQQKN